MPELIKPEHFEAITQLVAKGANAPIQRRARLLLLYDAGHATADVAQQVGLSVSSVLRWRRLYREQGMGIFPGFEAQVAAAPPASASAQPDAAPKAEKKKPKKKPKKKDKPKKKGKGKKQDKPKKKGKGKKAKKDKPKAKRKGGKGKKGKKKAKRKK